jgi:predicted nucleic-acid-binding Zn-ribbon protein
MTKKTKQAVPGKFSLAGRAVQCPHCQGGEFISGEAQLNTAMATLIELDWLNRTASILTCTACGQIQWFGQPPSRDS